MDPVEEVHAGRRLDAAQDGRGRGDPADAGSLLDEEQRPPERRGTDA